MGSKITKNDTLRINKEQGFPGFLDVEKHRNSPYVQADVEGQEFEFSSKPGIRVYNVPPVRNFLVEELDGKWIYWGLCFLTQAEHDYEKQETSGRYKIVQLYTPEQMIQMFDLTHYSNKEQNYFQG